jgi:putative aldouronate transport system substrate-binding protein
MKKVFLIGLLGLVPLMLFAAGGRDAGTGAAGDAVKVVTIKTGGAWKDKAISSIMPRKLGINMDVEEIDEEGWAERKGILFATNQLPDLFLGVTFTPEEEVTYGNSGQLIPLNALIDKVGVETKKLFSDYPYIKSAITTPNGNIYAMFANDATDGWTREMAVGGRLWLNTKWCRELNIAIPKTLDEFHDALAAFKRKDPNIIPVGGIYNKSYGDVSQVILNALGYVENRFTIGKDGKTVVFVPVQPEYREYLSFMNRLWNENLLDHEYFTQSDDTFLAKGQQGRYGFVNGKGMPILGDNTMIEEFEIIPPMTSRFNNIQMTGKYDAVNRGRAAITNKAKDPEKAYKLIDWCYSYEGTLMVLGITDEPILDGQGTYYTRPDGKFAYRWSKDYSNFWHYQVDKVGHWKFPFSINSFWANLYLEPVEVHLSRNMADRLEKYYKWVYPSVYFSKAQTDEINKYKADRESYIQQMDAKFITSETPLSEFDNYVRTLNSLGVPEAVKIYQDAYDVYIRNQSN